MFDGKEAVEEIKTSALQAEKIDYIARATATEVETADVEGKHEETEQNKKD
jgi:hypothetical protein